MVVNTKLFGAVEMDDDKVITFEQGLIGFEFLKKFVLLYKEGDEKKGSISWLQSLDEQELAFPIIDPFMFKEDYNPEINDNSLSTLGEIVREHLSLMVTLTVPEDIKKMSCNLRAPMVINTETKKGVQVIVENTEYPVKYLIYDILSAKKKAKEEC